MIPAEQWQPSTLHSGRLIRLNKLLKHARGFNTLILQHNRPVYRDSLIEWLQQAHPNQILIDLKDYPDFISFERDLEKKASENHLIHIINLESLVQTQQDEFYRGLNYHREYIAEITSNTSLLFWMPEPMIRDLALNAPDFWAWREQIFDFELPVEMPTIRWEADFKNTTGLEKKAKQKRIKEIQDYLEGLPDNQPVLLSSADLQHEMGNLLTAIGEYSPAKEQLNSALTSFGELDEKHGYARVLSDIAYLRFQQGEPNEALKILEKKVLPWFITLKDLKQQAATHSRIADIYQARGELDKALSIRQKDSLPVYEKLGEVHSKAITERKIAGIQIARGDLDTALTILTEKCIPPMQEIGAIREVAVFQTVVASIYQARGELNKALSILQNDSLPVYEKLGDIHSKAATMAQIADIYQTRGELDKALSILQNDSLPVYEKLGAIRSKAVTTANIADIYQARGELDKALNTLQNDVLPIIEKLGDIHSIAIIEWKIAIILWTQDRKKHRAQVTQLLCQAQQAFLHMQLPEADTIQSYLDGYGLQCSDSHKSSSTLTPDPSP